MATLDTNVLIRYLTQDNPALAARSLALLEQVEAGSRSVMLLEGVLVETVQVLSSKRTYNVSREVIRTRLRYIIDLTHIDLPNKRTYLDALDMYVDFPRLSFVDALCAVFAQRSADSTVISFDRGFRGIPGVTWERP
jgi:predicted nucleic acid-binding protein